MVPALDPYALLEGQNPLLGTHLNVPDGVNLMWNTSLSLPAALMTPVTELLGLPVTVTTLYTLALALSAWFASIAFRRYVRSYPAALLGGLVYGFSPAMIAQSSSHLHLTLGAVLPPPLLLLLDELLVRQRHHPLLVGAALGALAAAQVLIGEELLAFTGIAAAAMVVTLLVMFPRQVPARAGRACSGSGPPRWCSPRWPPGRWPSSPGAAAGRRRHPGVEPQRQRPVRVRGPDPAHGRQPGATSSAPTPRAGPNSAPSGPGCRAG